MFGPSALKNVMPAALHNRFSTDTELITPHKSLGQESESLKFSHRTRKICMLSLRFLTLSFLFERVDRLVNPILHTRHVGEGRQQASRVISINRKPSRLFLVLLMLLVFILSHWKPISSNANTWWWWCQELSYQMYSNPFHLRREIMLAQACNFF